MFRVHHVVAALATGAFVTACHAPSDAERVGRTAERVPVCPEVILDCQGTTTCCEENGCRICTCAIDGPPSNANASSCSTNISIPTPMTALSTAPAACAEQGFDLHDCLQDLILAKQVDYPWAINIKPNPAGSPYLLGASGGFIVFQKTNITIQGAPAPSDGGASPTEITFETYDEATSAPAAPLQFFAHIIDSSNITIADLTLDGGGHMLHGFGICPLGGDPANPTHDITIEGITAQGFLNFFTVAGQTVGREYLFGSSANAMLAPVYAFTGKTSDPSNPAQYCGGAIQNLTFQNNDLSLLSVGFYATPLSVREADNYSGLESPFLIGDGSDGGAADAGRTDWRSVVGPTSGANSGWYVGNNRFVAAIDPSYHPPLANDNGRYEYTDQMSGYFHSGLKIQGTTGLTIENNTLSVGANNPDMFAHGAGFNIAFDNLNLTIRNNQLTFASNYHYPGNALVVESGFILHPYYGVGALTYTQPAQADAARIPVITEAGAPFVGSTSQGVVYGVEGLAGPSLGVNIVGNTFDNGWMAVDACCDNAVYESNPPDASTSPILAWADVTDFCRDLDANQTLGNAKLDGWDVEDNTFNLSFSTSKPKILDGRPVPGPQPASVIAANAAFLASTPPPPFPEVEYCRQTFSWFNQSNKVCGPAADGGVACVVPTQ